MVRFDLFLGKSSTLESTIHDNLAAVVPKGVEVRPGQSDLPSSNLLGTGTPVQKAEQKDAVHTGYVHHSSTMMSTLASDLLEYAQVEAQQSVAIQFALRQMVHNEVQHQRVDLMSVHPDHYLDEMLPDSY